MRHPAGRLARLKKGMIMSSKLVIRASLAVALLGFGASTSSAMEDKPFIAQTIRSNMVEIELGNLAASKGSTEAVRSFGAQLKADHSASNEKALSLAKTLNARAPKKLNKRQLSEIDKLKGLSGSAFDDEFLTFNVRLHRRQVRVFSDQTKLSTGDVAAFASATLPTLEAHLKTAQSMAPKGQRKPRGARRAAADTNASTKDGAASSSAASSSNSGGLSEGTGQ